MMMSNENLLFGKSVSDQGYESVNDVDLGKVFSNKHEFERELYNRALEGDFEARVELLSRLNLV